MAEFDASHDYSHIHRVVGLARILESGEQDVNPTVKYRSEIIQLGCLLHNIADHKYLAEGQSGETIAERLLLGLGADPALATEVQLIANHVSYTTEVRDPAKVQGLIDEHPELAIVQDADRLEALGAHGMARYFAYNAIKNGSLYTANEYFTDKLEKLEGLMKTQTGRQMAERRTQHIRDFRYWWEEEKVVGKDQFEPAWRKVRSERKMPGVLRASHFDGNLQEQEQHESS